jgi:hypothetical protein
MDSEEATNTWRANPSLLVLLNAAWLAANTHFIVFSLIRLELEPTIYHSLEASTITITPSQSQWSSMVYDIIEMCLLPTSSDSGYHGFYILYSYDYNNRMVNMCVVTQYQKCVGKLAHRTWHICCLPDKSSIILTISISTIWFYEQD